MRVHSVEKEKTIIDFINSFFNNNRRTPSLREIESYTGISRPTAQRYLVSMNEKGIIKYNGNTVITDFIGFLTTQNIRRIPLVGIIACGEFQNEEEWKGECVDFPVSLLGKGQYFILIADGDSMIDAGIDEGDYIIVRKTNDAEFGQIVVAVDDENRNTLKRLEYDHKTDRPYLHPENTKYSNIYPAGLSILGVAEKVIKQLTK